MKSRLALFVRPPFFTGKLYTWWFIIIALFVVFFSFGLFLIYIKYLKLLTLEPEALKSLYRSPGYKKNQLVLWSYVKTMSCSGSHLGIPINIKNTKFVKDFPMIDAQFRFNQCNSFREEDISVFSRYGPVLILWPVVAAILDFRSA